MKPWYLHLIFIRFAICRTGSEVTQILPESDILVGLVNNKEVETWFKAPGKGLVQSFGIPLFIGGKRTSNE
jgi:hypothetical protein